MAVESERVQMTRILDDGLEYEIVPKEDPKRRYQMTIILDDNSTWHVGRLSLTSAQRAYYEFGEYLSEADERLVVRNEAESMYSATKTAIISINLYRT